MSVMKFENDDHLSLTLRIINVIAMKLIQAWLLNAAIIHIVYLKYDSKNGVASMDPIPLLVTVRIWMIGKVLFSQVSVRPQGGGTPVIGCFPGLWSHVLSKEYPGTGT